LPFLFEDCGTLSTAWSGFVPFIDRVLMPSPESPHISTAIRAIAGQRSVTDKRLMRETQDSKPKPA
jgi:hypothetical protein